ncbi:unnamed protein product [Calicophoron daubneyi]|uniref:Uncharacterized protein n=1 Tax=Calicophoron daubneyi TaxID=300641 RepID=A0AAV2T6H0_CALDB
MAKPEVRPRGEEKRRVTNHHAAFASVGSDRHVLSAADRNSMPPRKLDLIASTVRSHWSLEQMGSKREEVTANNTQYIGSACKSESPICRLESRDGPNSVSDFCAIRSHCAWCKKPRQQSASETVIDPSIQTDSIPLCCSQICFDHLRRAQFKSRHQNGIDEINMELVPSFVTSGRPPYTATITFSGKDIYQKNRESMNSPCSTSNSYILRSTRQITSRRKTSRTTVSAKVVASAACENAEKLLSQGNDFQSSETAASTQICAQEIISEALSRLRQLEPDQTFKTVGDVDCNSFSDHINSLSTAVGSHPADLQFIPRTLYVPIVIPVLLPIFKSAPEILSIMHRYGYHTREFCHSCRDTKDFATQTNPPHEEISFNDNGRFVDCQALDLTMNTRNSWNNNCTTSLQTKEKRFRTDKVPRLSHPSSRYYKLIDIRKKKTKFVKLVPLPGSSRLRGK